MGDASEAVRPMFKPLPPEVERARVIAAGVLLVTTIIAAFLIVTRPKPPEALRTDRLTEFAGNVGECRRALAQAGFEAPRAEDVSEGARCGYRNAVTLSASPIGFSEAPTTNCALAAALVLWQRDVVAPAAERHLGQAVARIEMGGPAYACRPVAGRRDGRMSEHARANAIDISGFTLADGRVLAVRGGWRGAAGERRFLRAVRDGACERFRTVLSPDYNRAHADHLHLDMGGYALCR
ncbi:extensin-like protein [alpha proteobacterium U9-1i]|nr:extensin-like protein [alpha proteobacterium U9-1i]